MGISIRLTCKECGKVYHTKNGCGISHARLESVIDNFESNDQIEIEKLGKASLFPVFQFDFQNGHCNFCKHIISVPVLKLPENGKEFIGVCEVCGKKLDKNSMADLKCTACNYNQWDITQEGFWD